MTAVTVNVFEMIDAYVARMKKTSGLPKRGDKSIQCIKTGFRSLDHCTGGLAAGDYVILAGRSSTGKTTLALNIGLQVALGSEKDVLYFSLASTKEMMMRKILTMVSQIPTSKIDQGVIELKDLAQIDKKCSHLLDGANLFIQDDMYSISDIEAEVLGAKEKAPLGLVIIDHLQLIETPPNSAVGEREAEIAAISRLIRKLSKTAKLPILLLSSVKSDVDLREINKKPLITDLDAPGSVEGDCDMVWMLYRDELYFQSEDNPRMGMVELAILKNRRGKLDAMELYFNPDFQRLEDFSVI